jgi:hypothetical protein
MSNGTPSAAPPPSSGGSLSLDDFAGKIKAQYPAYANVENRKLVGSVLEKYPVYKSQLKTDAIESLAVPKGQEAVRGAAQATGIRAAKPMSVAEMADTPYVKDMMKSNVDAAGFGAQMLGGGALMKTIGKALFKPSVSMVPEVSKLLGPDGKPIVNMIEKEGASAAGKAAGLTKEAVKKILTWANKNPTQSYLIYKGLEELGIAPHKAMKMLHVVAKD